MPYAEDIPYWKTGKSAPDAWLDRTEGVIEKLGGRVRLRARGNDDSGKQQVFVVEFEMGGERFRVVWPVLPSRSGDTKAAERQAATLLYHDAKARSLNATLFGPRHAFFQFLLLPNGQTAGEAAAPMLSAYLPKMLPQPGQGEQV